MMGALDWLFAQARTDANPPAPFATGPELRSYSPAPSERFSGWIHDMLGGGPGASLAHENFARGVPNILMATPLGIGLSAADLVHAKANNDLGGVAAAALGMIPGVGSEGRAAAKATKALDPTEATLAAIHEVLGTGPAVKSAASTLPAKGMNPALFQHPAPVKIPESEFGSWEPEAPTSTPWTAPSGDSEYHPNLGSFPTAVPFQPSPIAIAQGYTTPAAHGTKLSSDIWRTPAYHAGEPLELGGTTDALRLPVDELGVHFGTPAQAAYFTGQTSGAGYTPRTYPTVLQTGNSLEMRDLGAWYVSKIKEQLKDLNLGKGKGITPGMGAYPISNHEQYLGKFPSEEVAPIGSIQEMREYLKKKGYDSVNYINAIEGPGQRSYIMFNPSEEKNYVAGVRSPFASFDALKKNRPELAASIAAAFGVPTVALPLFTPKESK